LLIVAVAVALGLVTVTSCSSDDDDSAAKDEPSRTTERQTTTTIDARAAEEAAVKEARQKAEEVWKDSAAAPDPDSGDPALAESYVGPMLDRLTTTLQAWKANGWASRYPENSQSRLDIQSIRFDEDKGQPVAFLEMCAVDDSELFDLASGDVIEGGVHTAQLTEAMRKVDGKWKLAESRRDSYQEGVVGCATGQ